MKREATFFFPAIFVFVFCSVSVCAQIRISAVVVGVTDGDTVTAIDSNNRQIKVRLAGIDAPESRQDFGTRSKQNLSDLVYGKPVVLEGDKTDRNGRLVAKILLNGVDVNLEQIKAGLAWHFKRYELEQSHADRKIYAAAERDARNNKLSIWSEPEPVAPWDFRRNPTAPLNRS